MNKKFLFCVLILPYWQSQSVASEVDTLRIAALQEVIVDGVFVRQDAPFPVFNISQEALTTFQGEGKELPFLLSRLPGVVAWGENGTGFGTTHLRIRGASESRINITLDGVALNSPEDECVFWANMNSYAAFLGALQLQKGIGSSTNGDGAFGGNIALESEKAEVKAGAEATVSYGSYNSFNGGVNLSSGLFLGHFTADAAYHHSFSDGYMSGTRGKSGSLYVGLGYFSENIAVKWKNIFNYENTGQAWNGVDTGDLYDGNYGVTTGLKTYKDFYRAGLGRYNNLFERLVIGENGYATERYVLRDGRLWDGATDNFWQDKSLLSLSYTASTRLKVAATLHYTHGFGYYNELKSDAKLSKFGLQDLPLSDGETLTKTDFVRKKGLRQDTFGGLLTLNYRLNGLELIGGGAVQGYYGSHFGYLTYTGSEALWEALGSRKYRYYASDARKWDANCFVRASYSLPFGLAFLADVQYRWVRYTTDGTGDKFVKVGDEYINQVLDIDKKYHFVNPKVAVSYSRKGQFVSLFAGLSHREPERNNFTDNGSYPAPRPEKLFDVEAFYKFTGRFWDFSATVYYMKYVDQFVQTGELSDIGEALTTNVRDSYRAGVELSLGLNVTDWLTVGGALAWSRNRIKDFDEVVDDFDGGTQTIHYSDSELSFSPSLVSNFDVLIHRSGWTGQWTTAFVSRQYLDNTHCLDRSLGAYSTSAASVSYAFGVRRVGVECRLGLDNIFNRRYAASGWVYSAIYASGGNPASKRYTEIGYFPMAGRTGWINLIFRFK